MRRRGRVARGRFRRLGGLAALAAGVAAAPAGPVAVLDLDAAVGLALDRNPALRAARERASSSRERPAREGALPNPRATYMSMNGARSPDPVDAPERRVEIEQMFPGPGKRGLRTDAARAEAEVQEAEAGILEADLARDVRETYYELRGVRAAAEWLRREVETAGRMEKVTATRVGTARAGPADLLMAEGERTMAALALPDLDARAAELEERLRRLLGGDPGALPALADVPAPSTLPWTLDALLKQAADRPEIRRAVSETRRMEIGRDLMRQEGRPDYSIGLEYRSLADEPDMAMVKVGVELPIWRAAVGAGVREADRRLDAGRAEASDTSRRVDEDVRGAYARWQAAVRAHDLAERDAVPQAERRLAALEAGYRTGRDSFLDVLGAERSLLQARRMLAMTDSEAGMAAARLLRAAGVDPRMPWPGAIASPPGKGHVP